ncbi:MAG: FG-GAP repeat protein [Planctomycetota bacterium]
MLLSELCVVLFKRCLPSARGAHLCLLTVAVAGIDAVAVGEDAGWEQTAKFFVQKFNDRDPQFGEAVAISGDHVLIGAPVEFDSIAGPRAGAVYIFNRITGTEERRLTPSDHAIGDLFGHELAVHGDRALISSYHKTVDGLSGVGQAYLFDIVSRSEVLTLQMPDPSNSAFFGASVDLDSSRLVVGANRSDRFGSSAGAVYVHDAKTGALLRVLAPDDVQPGMYFGIDLAIDDDIAVITAPEDRSSLGWGSAYIFNLATGEQRAKIRPQIDSTRFFASPAIENGVVFIGCSNTRDFSGEVVLFDAMTGDETGRILPPEFMPDQRFGFDVAVDGDRLVVSALRTGARVYVYDVTTREEIGRLVSLDVQDGDFFGGAVGIEGSSVIVGASRVEIPDDVGGAGYMFEATPATVVRIEIAGTCPGPLEVTVSGATPNGSVALLPGRLTGTFTNKSTPCEGTTLDLYPPLVGKGGLRTVVADAQGNATFAGTLRASRCGELFIQALDLGSCEESNVIRIE